MGKLTTAGVQITMNTKSLTVVDGNSWLFTVHLILLLYTFLIACLLGKFICVKIHNYVRRNRTSAYPMKFRKQLPSLSDDEFVPPKPHVSENEDEDVDIEYTPAHVFAAVERREKEEALKRF